MEIEEATYRVNFETGESDEEDGIDDTLDASFLRKKETSQNDKRVALRPSKWEEKKRRRQVVDIGDWRHVKARDLLSNQRKAKQRTRALSADDATHQRTSEAQRIRSIAHAEAFGRHRHQQARQSQVLRPHFQQHQQNARSSEGQQKNTADLHMEPTQAAEQGKLDLDLSLSALYERENKDFMKRFAERFAGDEGATKALKKQEERQRKEKKRQAKKYQVVVSKRKQKQVMAVAAAHTNTAIKKPSRSTYLLEHFRKKLPVFPDLLFWFPGSKDKGRKEKQQQENETSVLVSDRKVAHRARSQSLDDSLISTSTHRREQFMANIEAPKKNSLHGSSKVVSSLANSSKIHGTRTDSNTSRRKGRSGRGRNSERSYGDTIEKQRKNAQHEARHGNVLSSSEINDRKSLSASQRKASKRGSYYNEDIIAITIERDEAQLELQQERQGPQQQKLLGTVAWPDEVGAVEPKIDPPAEDFARRILATNELDVPSERGIARQSSGKLTRMKLRTENAVPNEGDSMHSSLPLPKKRQNKRNARNKGPDLGKGSRSRTKS